MSKNIFYTADEWKKMANALDKNIKNFEKALAHAKNDLDIFKMRIVLVGVVRMLIRVFKVV